MECIEQSHKSLKSPTSPKFYPKQIMDFVAFLITNIIRILKYAILARVLLSWVQVNPHGRIVSGIHDITEPILKFFRNLLPRTGMMDFSPILAFLALDFLQMGIIQILATL